MLAALKMSFAGLLAAVLINLVEQLVGVSINFDQVIVPVTEIQGVLSGEGVPYGITLRYGIIGLAAMLGQWIKRRVGEQEPTQQPIAMPFIATDGPVQQFTQDHKTP